MPNKFLIATLLKCCVFGCYGLHAQELAFEGAAGFGAFSRGGKGGVVIEVNRLDDDVKAPQPGMLRWAVQQKGPRMIHFTQAGTIHLLDTLEIREPFLTLDGRDAPGQGVCIRGGTLEFKDTHDIILRSFRVRLGDETTKRRNREQGLKRPKNSNGLDCLSFSRCRDVIADHISASWSCDEVFSVVHCENVTVQWCLISEPLTNPELHPYGDNHAFGFNASASTLSVHHCLFARYVMRGPQFEANDLRKEDAYEVKMEAVNNVMFDYQKSGSRYTTGVEDHRDAAAGKHYAFQFMGNVYLGGAEPPAIQAVMKHEVHSGVRVHVDDPSLIQLSDSKGREGFIKEVQAQQQSAPLFASPRLQADPVSTVLERVLASVGCSHLCDAVDTRVLAAVRNRDWHKPIRSQNEVGGWPDLQGN